MNLNVIQDVDRPDVNGIPPKMAALAEQMKESLEKTSLVKMELAVYTVTVDDNIMSNVSLRFAYEPRDQWTNGIFHNANYVLASLTPMKGKRYYEPTDPHITVEVDGHGLKDASFRKYTGPADKAIARLVKWLIQHRPVGV